MRDHTAMHQDRLPPWLGGAPQSSQSFNMFFICSTLTSNVHLRDVVCR